MAAINQKRVLLGAVVAGVIWNAWGLVIEMGLLGQERYAAAQQKGLFLTQEAAHYPYFLPVYILTLFLLAYGVAWAYASVRATHGPGPKTALKVGLWVGFAAGFPLNFALANWLAVDRLFPFAWMLEFWVGAILAALVAGWLYKD
ncbi:MAG: hypothetical protein V3R29_01360 [Candidatus Acidoferrales bacterium]